MADDNIPPTVGTANAIFHTKPQPAPMRPLITATTTMVTMSLVV
jgi:hypothetical protein